MHAPTQDPPPLSTPSPAASSATVSLQHMATERTAKIARFKAQKEMEKKVKVPNCMYLTIRGGCRLLSYSNLSATMTHSPTDFHSIPWGKVKSVLWPLFETHFVNTTRCVLCRQLYLCFFAKRWSGSFGMQA